MSVSILQGDCLDVLPTLAAESVDACVTDPPYGLSFMGKAWDHGVPGVSYWAEVLRVLKPGGHLLAFGGTRTHHRLMVAIEDAGFEIRDCLMWLHGQGFPKGKGQLKPAWEPIILARKPAPLPWLNIEGCRIGTGGERPWRARDDRGHQQVYGEGLGGSRAVAPTTAGRWPANVCLDEEAAQMLDAQSGDLGKSQGGNSRQINAGTGRYNWNRSGGHQDAPDGIDPGYGDSGGASRFFYTAKASKAERGSWTEPAVRLRSDLTDDQRAYVLTELTKAGVNVG
jgi:site-specific DNA-methyltransferase (adenine-specific)